MLEKLVKNIGSKITTIALAGTLLLGSGCATYKTMSPSLIQPVTPIERPIKRPIDYSKLTWQEAIEYVQTPEQAQDYLDTHLSQVAEGAYESFRLNHTDRTGVCYDYAMAAAALLSDNGFPPILLELDGKNGDHSVFLYRINDSFYALGNTPVPEPSRNIVDLIKRISSKYGMNFDDYFIINLDENYPDRKWIDGEKINSKLFSPLDAMRIH